MGSVDGFPLMFGWELMVRIPRLFTFSSCSFRRLVSVARGSSFQGIHVTYREERGWLNMCNNPFCLAAGHWRNSEVPSWSWTLLPEDRIPMFVSRGRVFSTLRMISIVSADLSVLSYCALLCWALALAPGLPVVKVWTLAPFWASPFR